MKNVKNVLNHLGKRIRQLRTECRLSQEELAGKCGIHPTLVGKIERSGGNPSLITLERIAKGLGLPLYELFKFDDEEHIYSRNARRLEGLLDNIAFELKTARQYVRNARI